MLSGVRWLPQCLYSCAFRHKGSPAVPPRRVPETAFRAAGTENQTLCASLQNIRPTAEIIGKLTQSRHVGLLATEGTVKSESYPLEIQKFYPDIQVSGVACPFWVPLVEYNEANSPGADYFVKKRMDALMAKDGAIDTIILGCTHYPLLMAKIEKYNKPGVRIVAQGEYVARSLQDYLYRHPEMEEKCTKNGTCRYFTTENPARFKDSAQIFLHENVNVEHVDLTPQSSL